jgi:tRNA threonylcarbamoyladenosine biosynthesis protein TsaE
MPILDPSTLEFFSRSPEQTRRLGMRLGGMLQLGDLVCLSGDLGSGKTTLVQGIAQGWGTLDPVSSPTFVLVNEYRRPNSNRAGSSLSLYHLDAYRLASAWEAEELDLDRMLETGAMVIEWPERIKPVLPPERMWINLRWIADEQRGMTFLSQGEHYAELLVDFRKRVFGG